MAFHHPLTGIALEAFAKQPLQDRITLAGYLGDSSGEAIKLYSKVADDVLGCMKGEGLIVEDAAGWSLSTIDAQLSG